MFSVRATYRGFRKMRSDSRTLGRCLTGLLQPLQVSWRHGAHELLNLSNVGKDW